MTNALTAAAATRPAPAPSHDFTLLGIFTAPDTTHVLIRTETGAIQSLTADAPQGDLTLMETGDGWALLRDGSRVHRIVIA